MEKTFDYVIVGTGASGLQLAYRMCRDAFFKDKKVLIIDHEINKGNDRTWCFWEKGTGEWDDLLHKQWNHIYFGSQWFEKKINIAPYSYKMIRSGAYYQKLWEEINKSSNITFLQASVSDITDLGNGVKIATGPHIFYAQKVFSSIFLNAEKDLEGNRYPFLKQHFVGWFIKTKTATFDPTSATFMDFRIPQKGNTRFMYVLPTSECQALVEYTLFSEQLLAKSVYEEAIEDYLHTKGIDEYEIIEEEMGNIPMTSYKFHQKNTQNIICIGTAGGWTKASTGYTFKNIEKKSKQLIEFLKKQEDLTKFHKINKFWSTDLLMLKVLADDNSYGEKLFSDLFKNNTTQQLFQFLDEESSYLEMLRIMKSVDASRFIKAMLRLFLSQEK